MRISDWSSDVCSSDLLLSWFKRNIPGARVVLVANKLQNGIGELSRKEFESSVERAIDVTINFDPKLVSLAAKLGKSYAEIGKGTKAGQVWRSEEHTSELQSLMRISYAVFCLKKKKQTHHTIIITITY